MEIISKSLDDCIVAAEKILKEYPSGRIFAFYGSMGAGKTTLIKAFCQYLGVEHSAKSPTFAIVNEYEVNSSEFGVRSSESVSLPHPNPLLKTGEGRFGIGSSESVSLPHPNPLLKTGEGRFGIGSSDFRVRSPEKIYHFDFYRIEKEEEAFDIGFEEYLYSDNYCFIEWPERIENLLPDKYVRVDIEERENHERMIKVRS